MKCTHTFFLPSLHSRRKLRQKSRRERIITAIRAKVHRLDPIQRHRMHQTLHIGSRRRTIHQYGALVPIRARNRRDRRVVLVAGERILKLDHRVAVAEELSRREGARVEDDGGHVRGHGGVGVRGCVVHVRVDGARGGVVDVVEEDACDGDVGFGVARPFGVDADVRRHGGVGAIRVSCVDVAEGLHVGIAVEFCDAGDEVLVRRVAGCAGAAIGVDDHLPLHFGVGGDGSCGVVPG